MRGWAALFSFFKLTIIFIRADLVLCSPWLKSKETKSHWGGNKITKRIDCTDAAPLPLDETHKSLQRGQMCSLLVPASPTGSDRGRRTTLAGWYLWQPGYKSDRRWALPWTCWTCTGAWFCCRFWSEEKTEKHANHVKLLMYFIFFKIFFFSR